MPNVQEPHLHLEIAHVLFMDVVGYSKLLVNAQREMDCGDAGHILVSQRVADDLAQDSLWQPHLHELGEIEVKHGVKVGIVNLYSEEMGNPKVPEKLKGASRQPAERPVRVGWPRLIKIAALLLICLLAAIA